MERRQTNPPQRGQKIMVLSERAQRTKALAQRIAKMSKRSKSAQLFYRFYEGSHGFRNYSPGDKVLIKRQFGGFGDHLILSCLLNEIRKRYGCNITFACRETFMELYRGVPFVNCLPYDITHLDGSVLPSGKIRTRVTALYDIIIDLTVPCHIWEELVFDKSDCHWRNRLDMWGNWCDLYDFDNIETCIRITDDEKNNVRQKFHKGRKLAVLSPVSANIHKDFYQAPKLMHILEEAGYTVVPIGDVPKIPKMKLYRFQSKRDFLALMSIADLVISVDTAAFHAGAVMGAKTYGLFNTNNGQCYSKYYPTATPIQLCDKMCIFKYCTPKSCFPKNSIDVIVSKLKEDNML